MLSTTPTVRRTLRLPYGPHLNAREEDRTLLDQILDQREAREQERVAKTIRQRSWKLRSDGGSSRRRERDAGAQAPPRRALTLLLSPVSAMRTS